MLVTIDGCSASGKSFVAKQLSALTRWPAIMEGAVGVFPNWIFQSFTKPHMASRRTAWFIERCVAGCIRARAMASGEQICFLDSGPLTSEADCRVDNRASDRPCKAHLGALRRNAPDLSVLLVTDPYSIRTRIKSRARSPEQNQAFIDRAIAVQRQCIKISGHYNAVIIHRQFSDYMRPTDLQSLWALIARRIVSQTVTNGSG